MKKILFITALFFLAGISSYACEFKFSVVKGEKEVYSKGDVLVVEIKVNFTHRVCPLALEDTKFKTKGLKVAGAKDWEEVSPGVYTRLVKLEVTGTEDGKLVLNASRSCDKEGSFGALTLKSEPIVE
jgi:hypothetical protein